MNILKLFLPFVIVMIVAFVITSLYKRSKQPREKSKELDDYKHFVKRKYLMSEVEYDFYKVLEEAVKNKYHIIPQVQLSKIIDVNKYEKNKRKYFNMIDRKSVDFVLFDKQYFTPQIVIELDDSSHMLPVREDRDSFVNAILDRVGIKAIHIPVANTYNLENYFK